MSCLPPCLETDIAPIEQQLRSVCRRRAPRFHFDLAATGHLVFSETNHTQSVWLLDISELGIGFCLTYPLQEGAEILIKLLSRNKKIITLAASVVHSTLHANGDWRIGCQFKAPLDAETLDSVL